MKSYIQHICILAVALWQYSTTSQQLHYSMQESVAIRDSIDKSR